MRNLSVIGTIVLFVLALSGCSVKDDIKSKVSDLSNNPNEKEIKVANTSDVFIIGPCQDYFFVVPGSYTLKKKDDDGKITLLMNVKVKKTDAVVPEGFDAAQLGVKIMLADEDGVNLKKGSLDLLSANGDDSEAQKMSRWLTKAKGGSVEEFLFSKVFVDESDADDVIAEVAGFKVLSGE